MCTLLSSEPLGTSGRAGLVSDAAPDLASGGQHVLERAMHGPQQPVSAVCSARCSAAGVAAHNTGPGTAVCGSQRHQAPAVAGWVAAHEGQRGSCACHCTARGRHVDTQHCAMLLHCPPFHQHWQHSLPQKAALSQQWQMQTRPVLCVGSQQDGSKRGVRGARAAMPPLLCPPGGCTVPNTSHRGARLLASRSRRNSLWLRRAPVTLIGRLC